MEESKSKHKGNPPCKYCGVNHIEQEECFHRKPQFENDCLHCIYLGHFYDAYSVTKISADLYFCEAPHEQQLVAILDDEKGGTVTHLESIHKDRPFWTFHREAKKRAIEDGLMEDPVQAWLHKKTKY